MIMSRMVWLITMAWYHRRSVIWWAQSTHPLLAWDVLRPQTWV